MCTLTYVPNGEGGIITANRDETPLRNAKSLSQYYSQKGEQFRIAREPIHGGTNLAIGNEFTTILLNGAFHSHERRINYSRSRGLIVLDSLESESLKHLEEEELKGVEPFTLVRFGNVIEILRWDENKVHYHIHDNEEPFLVASAQLYSDEVRMKRELWFSDLLRSGASSPLDLWEFHHQGGDGDIQNDLVMNRNGMVCTVSITQIHRQRNSQYIRHHNIPDDVHESLVIH